MCTYCVAGGRTVLVAACALIDADGRVLIAQRPAGKELEGYWEFPGGKMEPGETPEATLIRELNEELGIEVAAACLARLVLVSYPYEHFQLVMPFFVCRRWSGIPMAREGQALKWVRAPELHNYRMPPADLPLIAPLTELL